MNCIKDLKSLGYIYQCTNEAALEKLMAQEKIAVYVGFDCTASSLHVGNLLQIMILRVLQQYGHKPIVLVGTTTTKIGDPTGKDEMRKCLSDDEIANNVRGIKYSLSKFIKFGDGLSDAVIVDNADWLESLGYIGFLRDYGRHFSINRMLAMDSVRMRIEREQSMTFLEFNYMLLQAYDFYHLNKYYNCVLQFGGADQWGNIVTGVDFTRKMNNKEVFGFTTPLMTTASGVKMGKSVSGAVWINEDMLSPYEYFQYWRNIDDGDLLRFAKLYGEMNKSALSEFAKLVVDNINEAKKHFAYCVTEICHGRENAIKALQTSTKVFEQGGADENLPTIYLDLHDIGNLACTELFVKSGLTKSKSEAKRLIRDGGAAINDIRITDENLMIGDSYLRAEPIKLSAGKKRHALVMLKRS